MDGLRTTHYIEDNPMNKKVLCIEDEVYTSELYARALDKIGYQTTIERDGKKGLELAQSDKFDIILLDLMLPSLSGLEILKILRDSSLTPHLHSKIIITTNLVERKSVQADIERQADGYIIKASTTPRQLVEFIQQIDTSSTRQRE